MKLELKCFLSLLKVLKTSKNSFLSSSDHIKQTSVALIFRLNPNLQASLPDFPSIDSINPEYPKQFSNSLSFLESYLTSPSFQSTETSLLEILLIKRGSHASDRHKGEIAFPGGKCEKDENDYQTVQREVSEEVGLDISLKNEYLSLGKLELNIFAYYFEGKSTYISMFIFFEVPRKEEKTIKVNEAEVEKAFWLPWGEFIHGRGLKKQIVFEKGHNYFFKGKFTEKLFERFFLRNLESTTYRIYLLSNGEKIFGLSFYMIMHILGLVKKEWKNLYAIEAKEEMKEIDVLLKKCYDLQYFVRRSWLPGYSIMRGYIVNKIFYRNRMRQFLVAERKKN